MPLGIAISSNGSRSYKDYYGRSAQSSDPGDDQSEVSSEMSYIVDTSVSEAGGRRLTSTSEVSEAARLQQARPSASSGQAQAPESLRPQSPPPSGPSSSSRKRNRVISSPSPPPFSNIPNPVGAGSGASQGVPGSSSSSSVKKEKTRSELTAAEQASRRKNFVAHKPTEEHAAKARELCLKVQAEGYMVPTHNQALGAEVGDLIKRMTDQGFLQADRGKQAAKKAAEVSVQFLPQTSWCKGCQTDRTGLQLPCMVEPSTTRCLSCFIESCHTKVPAAQLCSFKEHRWEVSARVVVPTVVPLALLGEAENPIEIEDSEDELDEPVEPGREPRPVEPGREPRPVEPGREPRPVEPGSRGDEPRDEPGSKRLRVNTGSRAEGSQRAAQTSQAGLIASTREAERISTGPNVTADVKPDIKPDVETQTINARATSFNKELIPIIKQLEAVAKPMTDHFLALQSLFAAFKLETSVKKGAEREHLVDAAEQLDGTLGLLRGAAILFKLPLAEMKALIDKYYPAT